MSSTEIVSPTKKNSKSEQIVSSGETNGSSLMDNIESSTDNNDDETKQKQLFITNLSETNKDCLEDVCMEPILLQNCVAEFSTNLINESQCVFSDDSQADVIDQSEIQRQTNEESHTDQGGGDGCEFKKLNLSLSLNTTENIPDIPKNKKFLESSDDQINQIFFSTIAVTPSEEDVLDSKCLSDNAQLTQTEMDDSELASPVDPADFFNRKIDEDETFDTTFTDTADNYQDHDVNLCSLNDNFNENYCSFSSIDYNTYGQHQQSDDATLENPNEPIQKENFFGGYAEQMRQQRPSIVIDCYDSDSNSDDNIKSDKVIVCEEEINCFYFDQTVEYDDEDAYELNDANETVEDIITSKENITEEKTVTLDTKENEEAQEKEDTDECFDTEDEENCDTEEVEDEEMISQSSEEDEGVINESCLSVNVSRRIFYIIL